MRSNAEIQQQEAEQFVQQYAAEVEQVSTTVFTAAELFVTRSEAAGFLTAAVAADARTAIAARSPDGLVSAIRPYAAHFVGAGVSKGLWALVDAADFLHDAVGTRWPYMHPDRRLRSLQWSQAEVTSVIQAMAA